MIDRAERQEVTRELSNGGYAIRPLRNLDTQPRVTYYTPDGKVLPNLPADSYSLSHYKHRGFTLTPPQPVEATRPVAIPEVDLVAATKGVLPEVVAEETPPPASPRRRVIKHRKSRGKIKGGKSV